MNCLNSQSFVTCHEALEHCTNFCPFLLFLSPERTVSGRVLGMMYRVGMLAPLLLFAFALISAITVFVLMVLQKIDFNNAMKMLGVSVVSMIIMFWIMLSRMRNRLLDPLSRLEASIARVISGEPDTHISLHAPHNPHWLHKYRRKRSQVSVVARHQ